MKIMPIQYEYNKQKTMQTNRKLFSCPKLAQNNTISNVFYSPINFKGVTFETKVIKAASNKLWSKIGGLFTPEGFIDMKKITYENLQLPKFDITKAKKDEITAYRFFVALLEGYAKNPADSGDFATQWAKKYNPYNISSPLAPLHFLSDMNVKEEIFAVNRAILKNPSRCKSLDVPVFDSKGNFALNGVVFDTETTGTKIDRDRIVQLGALVVKKGKILTKYDQLINPEMPIPPGASAVNRIYDKDVAKAPTLQEVAKDFLGNVLCKENGIIVTWNGVKFDMPLMNRVIREVRLANNISVGDPLDKIMMERPTYKVLDVQILHQRLHPFVGMSKRLSQQYEWLFCKPMTGAHDALADCRGTMSVLEYDCRVLNKARKDKTKPLTLRQVLQLQNGEPEVPNIDIKLHSVKGFNTGVDYGMSYRRELLDMTNVFDVYNLENGVWSIRDQIGEDNIGRFLKQGLVNAVVDESYKGNPLQARETSKIPGTNRKQTVGYQMRKNLETLFDIAGIEGYGGKTAEEIRELIAEKSKVYTNTSTSERLARGMWIKNVDPADRLKGNDLPFDDIAARVMESAKTNGLMAPSKKKK